jgi:hypothetical protein
LCSGDFNEILFSLEK